jgi:hypothetical protein
VRAALKALAVLARARPGARAWAVLGPMLELGERSGEEHDAIGRLAVRLRVDRLVAVGEGAARIHAGAGLEGSWGEESVMVADPDAALALVSARLRPGDVVLVKASNAVGLGRVARALLDEGALLGEGAALKEGTALDEGAALEEGTALDEGAALEEGTAGGARPGAAPAEGDR